MDDVLPESVTSIGSDQEYAAVRNHPTMWLPVMHRALEAAGMPSSGPIEMLGPSQYPTAVARDLGMVVTVYPEQWGGQGTYQLEVEAHALLEPADLPIPTLVAHGMLFPDTERHPWPWLVEAEVTGKPWSSVVPEMSPHTKLETAAELGAVLRRWHEVPHSHGRAIDAGWTPFVRLVTEELESLGTDDDRMGALPSVLEPQLRALAASTLGELDTSVRTKLLHSDIHSGNVLLDCDTGELRGLIDFNEIRGGDTWYDLADTCFRLMHGEPGLVNSFLIGYGLTSDELNEKTALRLLGWALLHDFDVLTPAALARKPTHTSLAALACHLTGLPPESK